LNAKTLFIYSVSYFNLGGLELCLGGLSPPGDVIYWELLNKIRLPLFAKLKSRCKTKSGRLASGKVSPRFAIYFDDGMTGCCGSRQHTTVVFQDKRMTPTTN